MISAVVQGMGWLWVIDCCLLCVKLKFDHLSFDIRSYKAAQKWHGFLNIRLAAFQASGDAYMKLRLAGTVNRFNVRRSMLIF
jgi:hypothetical protein